MRRVSVFKVFWLLFLALCLSWNWFHFLKATPDKDFAYFKGSDSNHYYAWVRSLAFDSDLNLFNDFNFIAEHNVGGAAKQYFSEVLVAPRTETGFLPNKYGIGSALLAYPLVRSVVLIFDKQDLSDFSPIYCIFFLFNQILLAMLGLFLIYKSCVLYFSKSAVNWALVAGTFGLSFGFYLFFEPAMAHLPGFFVSALVLYLILKRSVTVEVVQRNLLDNFSRSFLFMLGALCGLSSMIRFANICILVFVAVYLFLLAIKESSGQLSKLITALFYLGIGFVAVFSIQMFVWLHVYGTPLLYSYQGETIHFVPIHLLSILFGTKSGLFLWTPLALPAVCGLVLAVGKKQSNDSRLISTIAFAALICLASFLWVYGSWENYWLGGSYGMRGLIDFTPFFIFGLIVLLDQFFVIGLRIKFPLSFLIKLFLLIGIFWNIYLMIAYRAGIAKADTLLTKNIFIYEQKWFKQFKKELEVFEGPYFEGLRPEIEPEVPAQK